MNSSPPYNNNAPTSLMLMNMMKLLRPDAILLLRETNRAAVGAFIDLKSTNDDIWPLDLLVVSPHSFNNLDDDDGERDATVIDPILRVAPFPMRVVPKTPRSTARYRKSDNETTAAPPTPTPIKLSVTIDIEEQISKHGIFFVKGFDTTMASSVVPCSPLPPLSYMFPSPQLGGTPVSDDGGGGGLVTSLHTHQCLQHVCGSRTEKTEPPLLLELAHPTNFVKNFRYFDASRSDITVVVRCGDEGDDQPVTTNSLPARLVDTFLSGSSIELQRNGTIPLDDWETALGHATARNTHKYGMSRVALAASILSQPDRDEVGLRTQRFELPEDAICNTCGQIPIPVVWMITADFMAQCFSAATFGRDELVGGDMDENVVDDNHNITLDMSHIRNVVNIHGAFLYKSAVTNVLLPTMMDKSSAAQPKIQARIGAASGGGEESPIALKWDADTIDSILKSNLPHYFSIPVSSQGGVTSSGRREGRDMDYRFGKTLNIFGGSQIGYDFMRGCRYLRQIDLTPLSGVDIVGFGFMRDCSSLKRIDLSPLWYISTINSHFLGGCKSLVEVDLTALVHVKLFRPNFLDGCESLVSVTFPPLFKTTTDTNPIGICSSFMAGCSKINHLDMRPLGRYIEVKYDCKHIFRGCKELLKNNKKKSGEIGIADCGVLYADKVAMKAVKGGMRGDPAKEWEPPEFLSCVVC